MAGEGSMMHAIHTMRNNKALLKDKRRNSWKNYTGNKIVLTEDHIKTSPELLAEIRENCKKDKNQRIKNNILYFFLTVLFLSTIFYLIYTFFFNSISIDVYEQ
ncbi:hypothetical protein [uncultured Flavobacterium sp.]|uniref:hypothetical protein n=1 Tax=uncultured Flavobacterium sp. TaxID=165435 RepID=UPI0030C860E7